MSLSQRERTYIKARMAGLSDDEAARAAGYGSRCPPARVYKLAAKALALKLEPDLADTYRARREALEAKIEALRAAMLRPLYKERAKLAHMEALAELLLNDSSEA